MKEGLTYISERTGQLRYADDRGREQWIQQQSMYIPLEKIKRGQPVSVATDTDLKEIAGDNTDLYQRLLNSSDTYIVLTNPFKHQSTVGLAMEYNASGPIVEDGELKVPNSIHVMGQGLYIEDKNYYKNAFTEGDVDDTDEEYWPSFFDDYKESIGKRVYVKGGTKGELTIIQEEAYLAYNTVIVIGFVTDANIKDQPNEVEHGAIEVQIEGDDRGIIDSTTFEAIVGEDFYVYDSVMQINGESSSGIKVFALGNDDDEAFKFAFNFVESSERNMPNGFIAIQRIDGDTAFITTNGDLTEDDILRVNNGVFTPEDRAFAHIAKYFSNASGKKLTFIKLNEKNANLKITNAAVVNLENCLKQAMKAVAAEEKISLKDGIKHQVTDLVKLSQEQNRFSYAANDVGGTYEVYISHNLQQYFQGLYIESRGSHYNKGYAVIADIRYKNRQNIIGVYNSGHTGLIKQGTRAIFLKQGLYRNKAEPFETGATYYLGSHGNVFKVPQEFYNSIIQIGVAQGPDRLIVDCADSRQYNSGDLPVGYMKPSVKGFPEFGFWLMDGKTWHKVSEAESLFTRLRNWYSDVEIKYTEVHNFGSNEVPDIAPGFVIPEVEYKRYYDEENGGKVPAQIKYLAEAVYKEMPRMPFVRRAFTLQNSLDNGGKRAVLPDIDVTSLMIYGPDENRIQVPELESLDIKFFVDINNSENNRNWVQIEPGFHMVDNYKYYGFKWNVAQIKEASKSHPFGQFVVRAVYSGKEEYDTENQDKNTLGICYQIDPYSPPVSLVGYPAKVMVTKHDYYSREFDVENLFKDYVKESVVDSSGIAWVGSSVSGQAVRSDIKAKVDTNNLVVGDNKNGTVELSLSRLSLKSDSVEEKDGLDSFRITSDLRLASPKDNQNGWLLDYYNGILHYYNKDNAASTNLFTNIRNDDNALIPYGILKQHTSLRAEKENDAPHNLKNMGWNGNLNANAVQGAHLGYPQRVFSQNAGDTSNQEDYGAKLENGVTITIPYTQKYADHYITRLGDTTRFFAGENEILRNELSTSTSGGRKTIEKIILRQINNGSYERQIQNSIQSIIETYDINSKRVSFTDASGGPVSLVATINPPSSIKYKYILSKFKNKNAVDGITETYLDKDKSTDFTENLSEALQAIYEMPLATFKYNRDYESNDKYYKRFFGIIVESVAATRDSFKEADKTNLTTVDGVEYTYTDKEKQSAAEYMNLVIDNTESTFNTNNAIGILLKAAQETQERLLNLEVATYGKDSPTLPGNDTVNEKYEQNQKSTIAGLNRLVKALCREVFQDADPINSDVKGAWSEGGENYSRLDLIDKRIHGEAAKDDEGQTSRIILNNVTTYPADSSVTETVAVTRSEVKDEQKDNDFKNGQQYINTIAYTSKNDSNGSFDGINDAINRIVEKLNQLTTNVNGSDKIKDRPRKLDYIRQTLDTIIKDLYYEQDNEADINTKLETEAYKKTNLSRIDKLLQDLYNFDLRGGAEKSQTLTETFNSKLLDGEKDIDADSSTIQIFKSRSPETLDKINSNANIIDVIIQLISGAEADLVRTQFVEFKDSSKNDEGYKVNGEVKETTYNPIEQYGTNNKQYFNSKTILERLEKIETALMLLSWRTNNGIFFENLALDKAATPYPNVTSTDDFFKYISKLTGITFEKQGFYSTQRKSDYVAENIKKAVKGSSGVPNDLDLYNIVYDIVKRIKNTESNLDYNNKVLGTDYDYYVDTTYDKNTYESLENNNTKTIQESTDYTVTSDMQALLRLLYGEDSQTDGQTNNVSLNHFTVNDKTTFATKSILHHLYNQLYNVPQIRFGTKIEGSSATINSQPYSGSLDTINGTSNTLFYDPANPRATTATSNSLLSHMNRSRFIKQNTGSYPPPKNRIDILEDVIKALYKFIGLGVNTNENYYTGLLAFATSTPADRDTLKSLQNNFNDINQLVINGNADGPKVYNVYTELSTSPNTTYDLSSIALQAMYNTVDIVRMINKHDNNFSLTPSDDVTITNAKVTEIYGYQNDIPNGLIKSALTNPNTPFISTAIDSALNNIKALDDKVMTYKVNYTKERISYCDNFDALWTLLGHQFGETERVPNIQKQIDDIKTDKGEKTDGTSQSTLWGFANKLRYDVGSRPASSNTETKSVNETNDLYTVVGNINTNLKTAENNIKTLQDKTEDNDINATIGDKDQKDEIYKSASIAIDASNKMVSFTTLSNVVNSVVTELQTEMTKAIKNNRKLAALMAYMRCDDIKCDTNAIQFVRTGEQNKTWSMQAKTVIFNLTTSDSEIPKPDSFKNEGYIFLKEQDAVTFCGEIMRHIVFEDYIDCVKFDLFVPDGKVDGKRNPPYQNQNYRYKHNGQYEVFLDGAVESVTITNFPTNSTYTVGEELNLTGLTLSVKFIGSQNPSVETYSAFDSRFTYEGYNKTTSGLQTITIKYGEVAAIQQWNITVNGSLVEENQESAQ